MVSKRLISKQSLPDIIGDDIRDRILSGELVEGETIRQGALADEYDVSRMPIREALKRLNAEGLVQFTNNKSASVTKHSLKEIAEIFDLRILIEVDMFRNSIPNMKDKNFSKCRDILAAMDKSYDADDVAMWGALNFQYHTELFAAAKRNLTHEILQRVNLQSDRYVRMHLSVMKQRDTAKEDHAAMLNFAQNGEIEKACEILTEHISRTKEQLLGLIAANRANDHENS